MLGGECWHRRAGGSRFAPCVVVYDVNRRGSGCPRISAQGAARMDAEGCRSPRGAPWSQWLGSDHRAADREE
ncbi:hypothetical protein M6B38_362665 [Iris pallida]|uniref:Uncharacterized protein n=1 Tax=Iris pallida TaxID=29817 RepID=A0AAX6GK59_IRIPA|nr:hypothetical protein M6B38_362665 [Iris pallida]